MTAKDLPICVCGNGRLFRVRFRGFDHTYLLCEECYALWESAELRPDDDTPVWPTFMREHDLSYPDDMVWVDLPHGVGEIIRSHEDVDAVGVVTGLADKDGRAYDVELLDWYGRTTYSGRMAAGTFRAASEVWERRYHERRARAAGA